MLKCSYGWIDKWHKAKHAVVFSGMQLSTIMGHNGSIAWGFWSYSAARLSRTPTNEGYIDG